MTDDKGIRDDESDRDRTEQDDSTTTRRVARPSSEEEERAHETSHEAPPAASGGIVQQIWRRIQEDRSRPKRVEINTRGQNNMDRSKALLVLGTAVVLIGFAFLALFCVLSASLRKAACIIGFLFGPGCGERMFGRSEAFGRFRIC